MVQAGNTKGGSIAVPLTSCLSGLDKSVLQIKTKIVTCHIADSKPVKQEVNSTIIPPPLVFPGTGRHHIFVLYVTIPKLEIIPNIYTNPERNPERSFSPPPAAKLGEGGKALLAPYPDLT